MSKPEEFDVVILGAGIAGLTAADALIGKKISCAVVDPDGPGSGSSGAPLMLLNPATGRRAKMAWRAEKSFNTSLDLLQRVQKDTPEIFFETNGVIRPALTPEIADDFERSPEKYNWPDSSWVQWLDKAQFERAYPVFKNHHGGLVIQKGATVKGDVYLHSLSEYLVKRGLSAFYNRTWSLQKREAGWSVTLDDGNKLKAEKILFATGHSVTRSRWWSFLPLNCVKGQTAEFTFKDPLPLKSSVSSLGYMAFMPAYPQKLVVGSTYEHDYTHLRPDEQGLKYLREKLDTILPGWADQAASAAQWAGVRVTTADRKPVIGEHPELKGLYLFTALGSKGLIIGRYAAGILAESIISGDDVDPELSVKRFL